MWCTQCRTPFSWKTGLKINETIHNPHFYDWMKNGGTEAARNPMDIPCGGLPSLGQLEAVFPRKYRDWMYRVHRAILHVEQVVIPRSQTQRNMNDNEKDLRIQYLMNRISKNDWRDELYRREKVRQKHDQYCQIMQTFVAVASDWMRRMVIECPRDLELPMAEMNRFFRYIHHQIRKLNLRFKSSLQDLPEGIWQNMSVGKHMEETEAIKGESCGFRERLLHEREESGPIATNNLEAGHVDFLVTEEEEIRGERIIIGKKRIHTNQAIAMGEIEDGVMNGAR